MSGSGRERSFIGAPANVATETQRHIIALDNNERYALISLLQNLASNYNDLDKSATVKQRAILAEHRAIIDSLLGKAQRS